MPARLVRPMSLLLVLLALLPAAIAAQTPEAVPATGASGSWRIAAERELDIGTRYAALSPDGRRVAGVGEEHLFCVWEIETLAADCVDERLPIREETIAWAPDGTAVAFALDGIRLLYESDIYVYELATGELVNLTDDGQEGGLLDVRESDPPMDDVPTWSPDSQELVFARSFFGDEAPGSTAIMRIDRGGGAPVEVARLDLDEPLGVWMPMAWLPDGTLVYSQMSPDLGHPGNGVRTLDIAGGEPRMVMPGGEGSEVPGPVVSGVAGGTAIVYSWYLIAQFAFDADQPIFWLVDLATGERVPLPVPQGDGGETPWVIEAAFSPDGATALLVTTSPDGAQLMALDVASGEITPIEPEPREVRYLPGAPQWVEGGTVLLQRPEGPLVLTLEAGGDVPAASPVASPAASPVSSGAGWRITAERDLDIGTRYTALSPDGRWLAGIGPDDAICVWDVDGLTPVCADEPLSIRAETIAWSPDSTAVAFALDAVLQAEESDIYLFERERGNLVNLTDDGVEGSLLGDAVAGAPIDDVPAWSPDGERIAFVRSTFGEAGHTTTIMAIERSGGEPIAVLPLDIDELMAIWMPMSWLPDGTLLYAQMARDVDDPANGIWRVGVDDGSSPLQVVPGGADADVPGAMLADAAPGKAIAYSWILQRQFGAEADQPIFWLVDLASGERTPMPALPGDAGALDASRLIDAGLSPDGGTAFLVTGSAEGSQLMTMDVATGAILPLDAAPRDGAFASGVPQWASNNTVLLHRVSGPLLLTLEPAT